MAGFDLGSIISEASNLMGTQTQQANQVAGLLGQASQTSEEQADNIVKAGTLKAQATLVEQQGQLETQKANVTAANAFGTNVGDVSDIITQLGLTARETAVQLTKAQDEVTQIEANSDLLVNPAGWLKDLLQGDAARANRDALASKLDTTVKIANNLNAATQATVQTQNAITETLTTASIQANADATKALAEAQAAEARIQGLKYGADAINTMREVGAQNFARGMQVYSAITEDQRWRDGFALRQEQLKATQEARARGKQEDQYYEDAATRINLYNEKTGRPPVTATQVRASINQPGALGETFRSRELAGFRIQEQGGVGVFGNSPSEVQGMLVRDRPDLPESYAPAVGIYQEGTSQAQTVIQEATLQNQGKALSPQQTAQIFDNATKNVALNYKKNIQAGKGNPYEALAVSTVLSEPSTGLANTKFGSLVLQTLSTTGQEYPTPDLMLATGLSMVEKGEITMAEVIKGVSDFYLGSNAIKDTTQGFKDLSLPPAGDTYFARSEALEPNFLQKALGNQKGATIVWPAGAFSDEKVVGANKPLNWANPTDVTLAANLMASKKRAESILKASKASQATQ